MSEKTTATTKTTLTIAGKEYSDIDACVEALGYKPKADKWAEKTDDQKWQELRKKRNEQEVKAARKIVHEFATADHKVPLDAALVAALLRLAPAPGTSKKSGGNGMKNVFMDNMKELFPKVGTTATEIEVFAATKYGRGEMKAKIRQNLKKAAPEERMWIQLDEKKEQWKLLAKGGDQPKAWNTSAVFQKADEKSAKK